MSEKLLTRIYPTTETIVLSPMSGLMQKMITFQLSALTEMTEDELGYVGSACWINIKDNKRMIVSKFKYDHVVKSEKTGFGQRTVFIPELNNLIGYFYYGDIENYIYDVDVASNTIIFKWHMDILLAYLTGTSLLDDGFKISHKIITKESKKSKKNEKNDHEPILIYVERSYRRADREVATFSPEDVDEYFSRLLK